jgi:Ca-activated chloride channel homolog
MKRWTEIIMNKEKLDEITLTSYALNELSKEQMQEVQMQVEKDPNLQKEVEAIQDMAKSVQTELESEVRPRLTPKQKEHLHLKSSGKRSPFSWLSKTIASLSLVGIASFSIYYINQRASNSLVGITDGVFNNASTFVNDLNQSSRTINTPKLDQRIVSKKSSPSNSGLRGLPSKKRKSSNSLNFSYGSNKLIDTDSNHHGFAQNDIQITPIQRSNTESYHQEEQNPWQSVAHGPLSTFSIDVDTASYSNTRRFLNNGVLPVKSSIRLEEYINYFDYQYKGPKDKTPFAVHTELAQSPWHKNYKLARISLQGKRIKLDQRPASNLVFLLDVSGSMNSAKKLPLVIQSMKLLVRKLNENDSISIITYAGNSGVVLPPTPASEKSKILQALTNLRSGGGTHAQGGILKAYDLLQKNFIKGGTNRVILATDGDFNLGSTDGMELVELIKEKSKSKSFLTILGLGQGNLKDNRMETIANKGNGNYFYIDTYSEAKKVLEQDLTGTLITIAKDVKIQVEFNPTQVQAYRLIGYENRKLAARDFNDDKKDAGEIGAGHSVTALYEIVPTNVKFHGSSIDKLKYQKNQSDKKTLSKELMTVKLRYKKPEGNTSKLLEIAVPNKSVSFENSSNSLKWASAVATFGMILREDKDIGEVNMSWIINLSKQSLGEDRHGHRQEFIELVELAKEVHSKGKKWR